MAATIRSNPSVSQIGSSVTMTDLPCGNSRSVESKIERARSVRAAGHLNGIKWPIYLALVGVLIFKFSLRVFIPGGDWPLSPTHYFSMGNDLVMLIGLAALNIQLSSIFAADDGRRSTLNLLFWPGLFAGIGLLLIRFTSDGAWWTGHLI